MKILFVDDELFFMQPYVEAFQQKAEVTIRNSAIEAIEEIRANVNDGKYDCLVLDVMMPPPKGWELRTDNGLFTGTEILKECQDEIVAVELPILILTNQKLEAVQSRVNLLKFPKNLVKVYFKLSTRPFFAANLVGQFVEKFKKQK